MNRGSLDTLHLSEVYPSSWPFGIPSLTRYDGPLPERFVAWPNRKRADAEDGIHGFVDDDRFESLWKNPGKYRKWYEGRIVVSPDFSLWPEMPEVMQLWNIYRSRWLARAMHERGARVIPSVSWTDGWAREPFYGLSRGGTVAISAYGAKRAGEAYFRGYRMMTKQLEPKRILVIGGKMPDWLASDQRVTYRPSGTIGDRR